MDARRAQDLLKHICQDKDYGAGVLSKLPLAEVIAVVNKLLPECLDEAKDKRNDNDVAFFKEMLNRYRPLAIDKIKKADRLWVGYCELTGYPYIIDSEKMVVLYDYTESSRVEAQLGFAGYQVSFGKADREAFFSEIGHMYRNGYKKILFIDGKSEPFEVEREELYSYDEYFDDEYITNPGLESTMIAYFQEVRKHAPVEDRTELIKTREDAMVGQLLASEFMVPCIKEETEEEIEISHPYVDLTDRVKDKAEGEQVIAIPVFTDGYELDKCYEGHHENMLYKFGELADLTDELGASGIIINCLGISYYMDKKTMSKIIAKTV
jgi:hypothetical protein